MEKCYQDKTRLLFFEHYKLKGTHQSLTLINKLNNIMLSIGFLTLRTLIRISFTLFISVYKSYL